MAKKTVNKSTTKKPNADRLIEWYMAYTLENEQAPKSVYKFAKEHQIEEADFYRFFGSFDGLRNDIWKGFYGNTISVMEASKEYQEFTSREKLLTFFYTLFEVLSANRSYVLFVLNQYEMPLKNLEQLRGLRKKIRSFAKQLVADDNQEKSIKILQKSEMIFAEAVWIQFLFLLKFWANDNSPAFESTDVAIEKSVNTAFDVFDNTPLERIIDFGKFLWKEKMV